MLGVQRDHAVDVLRHAGGSRAGRIGRRDDHIGQAREHSVLGRREERRRVRPGAGGLRQRRVDVLAVELVPENGKAQVSPIVPSIFSA